MCEETVYDRHNTCHRKSSQWAFFSSVAACFAYHKVEEDAGVNEHSFEEQWLAVGAWGLIPQGVQFVATVPVCGKKLGPPVSAAGLVVSECERI